MGELGTQPSEGSASSVDQLYATPYIVLGDAGSPPKIGALPLDRGRADVLTLASRVAQERSSR